MLPTIAPIVPAPIGLFSVVSESPPCDTIAVETVKTDENKSVSGPTILAEGEIVGERINEDVDRDFENDSLNDEVSSPAIDSSVMREDE
jgi:hypothetical protein